MGTENLADSNTWHDARPVTALVNPVLLSLLALHIPLCSDRHWLAFLISSVSHHELVATVQNQLLRTRAEVRLPPVAS